MSIKTTNIADIKDQEGINDIEFKVNYDKDHKDYVRVTIQNKTSVIKKADLWNFVFSIVKADQQYQMIPVQKVEMEKYIKQHSVKIKNDMKAGDEIFVNCEVNVRKEVADAVRRELEEEGIATPYLHEAKS